MAKENTSSSTIKTWSMDDRPREKLLQKGRLSLSDSELLAIIIGSGSRGESAVDLSKRMLRDYGNSLQKLSKISIADLCKYKGIGEAKAINIVAALELSRRKQSFESTKQIIIKSSKDLFDIFYPYLSDLNHEEIWMITANVSNKVINIRNIGKGGIHKVMTDVRILIKHALDDGATRLFLGHNHPSGTLKPSKEDLQLTKQVYEAARLFNIELTDHIIIGEEDYYSFSDNNDMPF
ncbi:MAG: DNA repair protein RadC [Saprospiraceae bacterium]